jgi:inosose dehydratase
MGLDSRENPVAMAETFGDRLYGVHFKDFIFQRNRESEDVVVGTGNLDLPGLVGVMEKVDFDGYGVLEYEGDVDNPVPALADCITEINKTSIGK